MERLCKSLSGVMLALGFLGSIIVAWTCGMQERRVVYSTIEERNWGLTLLIFLVGVLSTGFASLIVYWMGEVAGRLNDIARGVKTSASSATAKSIYTKDNSWICKKCENMNFLYESTCKCGQRRENNDADANSVKYI